MMTVLALLMQILVGTTDAPAEPSPDCAAREDRQDQRTHDQRTDACRRERIAISNGL